MDRWWRCEEDEDAGRLTYVSKENIFCQNLISQAQGLAPLSQQSLFFCLATKREPNYYTILPILHGVSVGKVSAMRLLISPTKEIRS